MGQKSATQAVPPEVHAVTCPSSSRCPARACPPIPSSSRACARITSFSVRTTATCRPTRRKLCALEAGLQYVQHDRRGGHLPLLHQAGLRTAPRWRTGPPAAPGPRAGPAAHRSGPAPPAPVPAGSVQEGGSGKGWHQHCFTLQSPAEGSNPQHQRRACALDCGSPSQVPWQAGMVLSAPRAHLCSRSLELLQPLLLDVGALGVALGAHRDVLAHLHPRGQEDQGACDFSSAPGEKQGFRDGPGALQGGSMDGTSGVWAVPWEEHACMMLSPSQSYRHGQRAANHACHSRQAQCC